MYWWYWYWYESCWGYNTTNGDFHHHHHDCCEFPPPPDVSQWRHRWKVIVLVAMSCFRQRYHTICQVVWVVHIPATVIIYVTATYYCSSSTGRTSSFPSTRNGTQCSWLRTKKIFIGPWLVGRSSSFPSLE